MRFAIPCSNGTLCMHLGHCEHFAIIDADAESGALEKVQYVTPPPHEPGLLPRWLHEQQVQVVIAGGMGQRAQALFDQAGIQVVAGATPGAPEAVVQAFLDQTLEVGQNACDH